MCGLRSGQLVAAFGLLNVLRGHGRRGAAAWSVTPLNSRSAVSVSVQSAHRVLAGGEPQRAAVHSWAFAQLGGFVAYKAKQATRPSSGFT
jgi:hypothetical protein